MESNNSFDTIYVDNLESLKPNDKDLIEVIKYAKRTHNEQLSNLCEKIYYSIKNGVKYDIYLLSAQEIISELKIKERTKKMQDKISEIKILEKELKEAIAEQEQFKNAVKRVKETYKKDQEQYEKDKAYLMAKKKEAEEREKAKEDEDAVYDLSSSYTKLEEDTNINLALLDDDITKDFNSFEDKELDEGHIIIKYILDNKIYTSIVDTNLDSLIEDINKIYKDEKIIKNNNPEQGKTISINDIVKDIETYYKYKEYVRYYYNSYKNNLDQAIDYKEHIKLLNDLTSKINNIIANEKNIPALDTNLDNTKAIIIQKLKNDSPINTDDVLQSIYGKEQLNITNTKAR